MGPCTHDWIPDLIPIKNQNVYIHASAEIGHIADGMISIKVIMNCTEELEMRTLYQEGMAINELQVLLNPAILTLHNIPFDTK